MRSRCLPACSNSSSALVTAEGSTGSECRSAIAGAEEMCCRFDLSVGGVFDSGGDIREGVMGSPAAAVIVDAVVISSVEMGGRSVGAMMGSLYSSSARVTCARRRVDNRMVSAIVCCPIVAVNYLCLRACVWRVDWCKCMPFLNGATQAKGTPTHGALVSCLSPAVRTVVRGACVVEDGRADCASLDEAVAGCSVPLGTTVYRSETRTGADLKSRLRQ